MKKYIINFIKYISNKLGFKIAMIKITRGRIDIEGDKELLRYVDISGYTFKKPFLKRTSENK